MGLVQPRAQALSQRLSPHMPGPQVFPGWAHSPALQAQGPGNTLQLSALPVEVSLTRFFLESICQPLGGPTNLMASGSLADNSRYGLSSAHSLGTGLSSHILRTELFRGLPHGPW